MRRLAGVVFVGALATALLTGIASSATLPAASSYDLSAQVMLRLFGETSDTQASLAAAYGDRSRESPLRDLALDSAVNPPADAGGAIEIAAMPTFASVREAARLVSSEIAGLRFPTSPPRYSARSLPFSAADPSRAPSAFTVGAYEPVAPVPVISPEPGALSFGPLARTSADLAAAQALSTGDTGAIAGTASPVALAPENMHVGPVAFEGRVENASSQVPQIALNDNAYNAGANFDVRAGARKLNIDLSTGYEHLTRNDANTFSSSALGTNSSWQLPGDDVPLVVPNYADMSRLSVGAAVAVPVVNGLTLNLNYNAQRMLGGYGLPGVANLDAIGNSYGGKLIFAIPHSSSTLSIGAHQDRYQDNVLSNGITQTRGDVNLTVKF